MNPEQANHGVHGEHGVMKCYADFAPHLSGSANNFFHHGVFFFVPSVISVVQSKFPE
ncbi:MAG: hypothetical protein WC029_11325 [Sulfuricella sp.]|jgi:hypothetical protein